VQYGKCAPVGAPGSDWIEPATMDDKQPLPHRLTAAEVRKKYGTGALLLVTWEIWCIRDGWFHPHYEYIGFSRFMAYVSAPVLLFCIVMTVSASRALRRQQQARPHESPASPDHPA
jgi:hypothetical protein